MAIGKRHPAALFSESPPVVERIHQAIRLPILLLGNESVVELIGSPTDMPSPVSDIVPAVLVKK